MAARALAALPVLPQAGREQAVRLARLLAAAVAAALPGLQQVVEVLAALAEQLRVVRAMAVLPARHLVVQARVVSPAHPPAAAGPAAVPVRLMVDRDLAVLLAQPVAVARQPATLAAVQARFRLTTLSVERLPFHLPRSVATPLVRPAAERGMEERPRAHPVPTRRVMGPVRQAAPRQPELAQEVLLVTTPPLAGLVRLAPALPETVVAQRVTALQAPARVQRAAIWQQVPAQAPRVAAPPVQARVQLAAAHQAAVRVLQAEPTPQAPARAPRAAVPPAQVQVRQAAPLQVRAAVLPVAA
jgi:hypothetical protein